MKAIYINYMKCAMALLMGVLLVACDNAVFSDNRGDSNKVTDLGDPDPNDPNDPNDPTDPNTPDLFFFQDSFERNNIYVESVYQWMGFLLDAGIHFFDFQLNGMGARIPAVGEFGPASDGQRFLLMHGNEDAEVETIQVISQNFDLGAYNTVVLDFDFMTFGLNDAGDAPETLKIQVCAASDINLCGANEDAPNAAGLQSANWVDVFVNNPAINDDNFNGKNHTVNDWQHAQVLINLRNPNIVGSADNFIFRIVAVMNDGVNNSMVCPDDGHDHDCKNKKDKCKDHHWNGKGYGHANHEHCDDRATASTSSGHKDCKHKDCKKDCKHKDCKKDCKHKCPDDCVPGDGSLKDGAAVDNIRARATVMTIGDR